MGIAALGKPLPPLQNSQELPLFFQPFHLRTVSVFWTRIGVKRGILGFGAMTILWDLGSDSSLSKPSFCLYLFAVLPWGKKSPLTTQKPEPEGESSTLLTFLRTSSSSWACVHRLCSSLDLCGKMGAFSGVQHNSLIL